MVDKIKKLKKFEERIGGLFNNKQIKAPIHLSSGNEKHIIEIFKRIKPNDWVCCTWRNHYQALLKKIPETVLEKHIVNGKSMVLTLPEYKFICSSIVGGIPSIAAGIALGEKQSKTSNHVWCWVGDMSSETGAFHEAYKLARNWQLPITFIVENNNTSVLTPTNEVWSRDLPYFIDDELHFYKQMQNNLIYSQLNLLYYEYKNDLYPHAGAGQRIQF